MGTVIIGGTEKVRNRLTELETASLAWGINDQAKIDNAEACLNQMASCLKELADGCDGTAYPFPP